MTKLICKVSLLIGRPLAYVGVAAMAIGVGTQEPTRFAIGFALIATGFVVAWFGKIGLFMVR